jgi:hypothetical protein
VTGYTSPSSWDASVNLASVSSINFDGIIGSASDPNLGQGLPNFTYFSSPTGLTLGGVNFQYTSTTPGLLFVLGDGYYYPGQSAELSAQANPELPPGTPDGMTITFHSPVTAFSMTMESFFGSPFTFDVAILTYRPL